MDSNVTVEVTRGWLKREREAKGDISIIQSSTRTALFYPEVILLMSLLEVKHPVSEGLERRRRQPSPDGRNLSVVERPRDVVQLVAHSNFPGQRLQMHQECLDNE